MAVCDADTRAGKRSDKNLAEENQQKTHDTELLMVASVRPGPIDHLYI
jgi:hypothetical protein